MYACTRYASNQEHPSIIELQVINAICEWQRMAVEGWGLLPLRHQG